MMEDLWECTKCGWIGTQKDMGIHRITRPQLNVDTKTCPKCNHDDFQRTNYFEITIPR